jgi:hypothetical protein
MVRPSLLAVLAVLTASSPGLAEPEVRTYRFVPDGSLPYNVSCGECSPPFLGARADVAGTFQLQFDLAAETASLDILDDQLVNYFDVVSSPSGPLLVPGAPPNNAGIIPSSFSELEPPYGAGLEIHISGDPISFYSNFGDPVSFNIFMTGNEATFNMVVPIDDFYITVENAKAVRIPEATTAVLALIAIAARMSHHNTTLKV